MHSLARGAEAANGNHVSREVSIQPRDLGSSNTGCFPSAELKGQYPYPHFTGGETKAQRGEVICPASPSESLSELRNEARCLEAPNHDPVVASQLMAQPPRWIRARVHPLHDLLQVNPRLCLHKVLPWGTCASTRA